MSPTAEFRMKAWNVIAVLGLVLVCGINVVAMARRVPPPPRAAAVSHPNVVMRHQQRLAGVREALARRGVRGTIGYLADVPVAELSAHPRGMEEYFLTQFALVPWVLEARADDRDWLVANLHATSAAERMPAGFRVAEDFGGGVALLERIRR